MSDPLLPTPTGITQDESPEKWHARNRRLSDAGKAHFAGETAPLGVEVRKLPTSASSRESAGWISRWKRMGLPASDRLSGMTTAPESSSDGGRLFPVGEMSRGSTSMLSTPATVNRKSDRAMRSSGADGGNGRRSGGGQSSPPGLEQQIEALTSSSEASPASPPPPPDDGREPPTIAGSGLRSPVSLASYDPELSSWRTSQVSLLSTEDERFPRSSERWPTSGMTRRGRAFALPMSERATSASGSSSWLATPEAHPRTHDPRRVDHGIQLANQVDSLLHTPTTGDTNPSYDHRASPGYTRAIPVPNLAAQIEDELLPTPNAGTTPNGHGRRGGQAANDHQSGADLEPTVRALLPTPKTPTGGSEKRAGRKARGSGGEDLEASLRSLGEPTDPPSEDGSE